MTGNILSRRRLGRAPKEYIYEQYTHRRRQYIIQVIIRVL